MIKINKYVCTNSLSNKIITMAEICHIQSIQSSFFGYPVKDITDMNINKQKHTIYYSKMALKYIYL